MLLLFALSVQQPWPAHVLNRGTASWEFPLSHSHHIPAAQPSVNSQIHDPGISALASLPQGSNSLPAAMYVDGKCG